VFNKKVILYGSEGNVKTFSSKDFCNQTSIEDYCQEEVPQANVTVAPPIILACNICDCNPCNNAPLINVPSCVANKFRGEFSCEPPHKAVCLTIGLFSIVSLERNVQMLIPVYEYCLPDKECVTTTDDPCELFKRIKFPVNDFFPPRLEEVDDDCGC
jgi:hypothetical protein